MGQPHPRATQSRTRTAARAEHKGGREDWASTGGSAQCAYTWCCQRPPPSCAQTRTGCGSLSFWLLAIRERAAHRPSLVVAQGKNSSTLWSPSGAVHRGLKAISAIHWAQATLWTRSHAPNYLHCGAGGGRKGRFSSCSTRETPLRTPQRRSAGSAGRGSGSMALPVSSGLRQYPHTTGTPLHWSSSGCGSLFPLCYN